MDPSPQLHIIATVGNVPLTLVVDKASWKSVGGSRNLFKDKNNVYCFRQRYTGQRLLLTLDEVDAEKLVLIDDYKSADPDLDRELRERKTEFPDLVATDGTVLIDMFCSIVTFEDFVTRSDRYQRR